MRRHPRSNVRDTNGRPSPRIKLSGRYRRVGAATGVLTASYRVSRYKKIWITPFYTFLIFPSLCLSRSLAAFLPLLERRTLLPIDSVYLQLRPAVIDKSG